MTAAIKRAGYRALLVILCITGSFIARARYRGGVATQLKTQRDGRRGARKMTRAATTHRSATGVPIEDDADESKTMRSSVRCGSA
jgi:hypothetical protein